MQVAITPENDDAERRHGAEAICHINISVVICQRLFDRTESKSTSDRMPSASQ
jgi:hypothetical protein